MVTVELSTQIKEINKRRGEKRKRSRETERLRYEGVSERDASRVLSWSNIYVSG